MKDWHLWTIIPSIFLLTLIYLGLGNIGHWNYTKIDFFMGNALVSLGIGGIYLGENIFRRFKK